MVLWEVRPSKSRQAFIPCLTPSLRNDHNEQYFIGHDFCEPLIGLECFFIAPSVVLIRAPQRIREDQSASRYKTEHCHIVLKGEAFDDESAHDRGARANGTQFFLKCLLISALVSPTAS